MFKYAYKLLYLRHKRIATKYLEWLEEYHVMSKDEIDFVKEQYKYYKQLSLYYKHKMGE